MTLHKCCHPDCPGFPFRASEFPHPCGNSDVRGRTDPPLGIRLADGYEPGNGTRYELAVVELPMKPGYVLVAWANGPRGGRAAMLPVRFPIHVGYLAEKLDIRSEVDAVAIGRWLEQQGVPVEF